MGSHLVDGEFQSDKYPTTPRGKVPLSTTDETAQDLLWEYARRHRAVDAEFSDDLEAALTLAGYAPSTPTECVNCSEPVTRAWCELRRDQRAEFRRLIEANKGTPLGDALKRALDDSHHARIEARAAREAQRQAEGKREVAK